MNSFLKKCSLLTAVFLVLMFGLCSCQNARDDSYFSYTRKPFSLNLQGEMTLFSKDLQDKTEESDFIGNLRKEPITFSAQITATPLSPGAAEWLPAETASCWRIRLSYTGPESLCGLSLSCLYAQSEGLYGNADITYDQSSEKMHFTLPTSAVQTLMLPALCLFPQGDLSDVSAIDNGCRQITLSPPGSDVDTEAHYTFDTQHPFPLSVEIVQKNLQCRLVKIS